MTAWHISNIVRFTGCRLCQELIAQIGEAVKSLCIFSTAELPLKFITDIRNTGICKSCKMAIAIG